MQSYNADGVTMKENWSRSMDYIEQQFKIPWYMFHRVDLHDELKLLAFGDGEGVPVELKLGCRVLSVVWFQVQTGDAMKLTNGTRMSRARA